jgi:hypothetical protein
MGTVAVEPIRGALPPWLSDGNGYGNGDGNGYGDGDGYGYGDVDGYGDGDGYGYGDVNYWRATISNFSTKWSPEQRARLAILKDQGATIAFWRSTQSGLAANGGSSIKPAAPGVVHTSRGPLVLCTSGVLHATLLPPQWKGERIWIVALTGEVVGDDEKLGALSREIIGEAL